MSSSKRLRLDGLVKQEESFCLEVLFNVDLIQYIFRYLYALEILKLFKINKIIYNFFTKDHKSLNCVKATIKYDFGDILTSKYFEFKGVFFFFFCFFLDKNFENIKNKSIYSLKILINLVN